MGCSEIINPIATMQLKHNKQWYNIQLTESQQGDIHAVARQTNAMAYDVYALVQEM